jgi:ribosomal protein S4E
MPAKIKNPDVKNGDRCTVIEGRHKGKSGVVEDHHIAKSGHATITLVMADGTRCKTLAKSVQKLAAES